MLFFFIFIFFLLGAARALTPPMSNFKTPRRVAPLRSIRLLGTLERADQGDRDSSQNFIEVKVTGRHGELERDILRAWVTSPGLEFSGLRTSAIIPMVKEFAVTNLNIPADEVSHLDFTSRSCLRTGAEVQNILNQVGCSNKGARGETFENPQRDS